VTIEVAGARSILRDPVFARLWFIQAANQIGGNMALYALTVLVYSSTRSNSAVSALLVSFVLPQIALSPFAGVVVDRLDLRWALIVPNVIRTVVDGRPGARRHEHRDGPRAQSRVSLMSVAPDAGGGLDDPPGRPEGAARGRDERLQPDAPGIVRDRLRIPRPLMTDGRPSFVLGVVTAFYVAASIACVGLPSAPPIEQAGR
jgi:MFS family permease